MLEPGLVSVTFRQLPPEEIVRLAQAHGLRCIEWGGDVHCPHGDTDAAQRCRKLTLDAGLGLGAYGSYYRFGGEAPAWQRGGCPAFEEVLDSAQALGVPSIRVWAGATGSADATPDVRARIAEDGRRVCELARAVGMRVGLEFHDGTLTDDAVSARALWREINSDNLDLNWQPPNHLPFQPRVESLLQVLPHLGDVHVFNWTLDERGQIVRHPLSEAKHDWQTYLGTAASTDGVHRCLLEFVPGDDPANLGEAAEALRDLIDGPGGEGATR